LRNEHDQENQLRFTYSYDRDSNRLSRTNVLHSAFNENYGYDNLNQLTSFTRGTHSITWSLDAVGNFSSTTTDGGNPVSNSFNKQNEETAAGTANLAFDNNGNTTTDDQGKTLVYDAWNRLVAYKNGTITLESYSYDALNRRIIQNPGTATDLYYSAAWQVLEERTGGVSTATIQYVWSPVYVDAMVLRDRSTQNNGTLNERLWEQQDANWNVTALVNSSGSVVERYLYDPYGKQTVLDSSWNTRSSSSYSFVHGFQGARLDVSTGLYDERYRQMSPTLGRWLTFDPQGPTIGKSNAYRAFADDPSAMLDPLGLASFKVKPPSYKDGEGTWWAVAVCRDEKPALKWNETRKRESAKNPCFKYLLACMEAHEQIHLWQILMLQEDICKGVRDGWEIDYVGGKGLPYYDLEIEAYKEQIKCLLEILSHAPKKCEEYIREELARRAQTFLKLNEKRIALQERIRRQAPEPPSTGDWYQGPPRNGIEEGWENQRDLNPIWQGHGRPRQMPYPIRLPPRIRTPAPCPTPR
jgi:RHS repeat-associated protein